MHTPTARRRALLGYAGLISAEQLLLPAGQVKQSADIGLLALAGLWAAYLTATRAAGLMGARH